MLRKVSHAKNESPTKSSGRRLAAISLIAYPLFLAGCATNPGAVFVDLDQAVQAEALTLPPGYQGPTPPSAFASSTLSFPALPATTYSLGSDKERIRQVEAVIKKSREDALAQIAARLKETYRKDLDHAETLELEKLKPGQIASFETAFAAAHAIFQDYANKRGPLLAHLSVLVGFPDQDPNSQQVPPTTAVIATIRFKTAKTLRSQIADLDRNYNSQTDALYAKAQTEVAVHLKGVADQFDRLRAEADARAGREADAEVSREQAQLQSVLADKAVVSFPAQPGRTVSVQGSTAPSKPPTLAVPGRDELVARLRDAEASDVKIWAGLNGYVISSDRRRARNATGEFIRWEKSHLASP